MSYLFGLSKSISKWEKEGRKENFVTKCFFFFLTFPGEYKSISKYIHMPNSGDLTNKVKSKKK